MASLIIHHSVRDYAAWRPGYDAHESSRVAAGITDCRVYRNAENPNDIVIVANVADPAKARAWTASDDLKTAMKRPVCWARPQYPFDRLILSEGDIGGWLTLSANMPYMGQVVTWAAA